MSAFCPLLPKPDMRAQAWRVFDVKVLGRPGCCPGMRAIGSDKPPDSSFLIGDMLAVGLS
jgi:hypothetical protein